MGSVVNLFSSGPGQGSFATSKTLRQVKHAFRAACDRAQCACMLALLAHLLLAGTAPPPLAQCGGGGGGDAGRGAGVFGAPDQRLGAGRVFAGGARVNGQPDLELRAMQGALDEALFARVATHPQVALASPVLELSTYATGPDRKRVPVRVVGVDALLWPAMAPALMPLPLPPAPTGFALLAPATVFLNAAACQALGGVPSAGSARPHAAAAGSALQRCVP
jgi:hypothetical protein